MLMEWAKNQRPRDGEAPERYAERLIGQRKPHGFVRHLGTEFYNLQKWAARYRRDPALAPAVGPSEPLDADEPTSQNGQQIVFELYHHKILAGQSPDPDDEKDNPKSIGLFSSIDRAQAAIELLKNDEGFRDWPGGFRIYSYPLDDISWLGGYGPDPYLDAEPE